MRQLTSLDAQFLNVESPTTVGHVGSLVVLDPSTAPDGQWTLETVRAVFEPRLHLAAPLRQRLVPVPLGLGRPYWVDDPHFDIEFHLRELALPAPGTKEQLGEQVARIHARQLDRTRPLWEAYVITGLEGGSRRSTRRSTTPRSTVSPAPRSSRRSWTSRSSRARWSRSPSRSCPGRSLHGQPRTTGPGRRRGEPGGGAAHGAQVPGLPRRAAGRGELPGRATRQRDRRSGRPGAGHSTPDVGHRALHAPRTPLNGHITPRTAGSPTARCRCRT